MATIALCADDYGLSPAVSEAIRELAAARRISAASAMTVFPEWAGEGARIRDVGGPIEWGLHLTLTDAAPLGPMPRLAPGGRLPALSRILALALTTGLPREEIAGEIARQLDAFEAATGFVPSFIDGHQHVHVLCGVREEVLALFGRRLDASRTWVRVCTSTVAAIARRGVARRRALIVDRLSRPLARMVRREAVAANDDFRGVNDLHSLDVAPEFEAWLAGPGERPLIMCHPGRVDDRLASRDPVLARREAELAYLSGPRFADALAARDLAVAPLPR